MDSGQNEEERINSLAVEIRLLESTYNELTARQNLIERLILESRAAIEALSQISELKPGEILVPIGAGAMLRFPPPSSEKVLINVGSNVVLEKNREEAISLIQNRLKEAESSLNSILAQRNQIIQRLEADRQMLESLISRQTQKG